MTTIERISAPISFADGLSKGWERVPLGEVLTPVSRPVSVVAGDTYALLGMHWYAQGLYVKDRKPGASIQASTLYQVHEGDFVYNRLFAWKGSFGIADATVAGCYVSNEFPCFRVVTSRAEPQYLRWYFSQAWLWQAVEGQSSGSTPTSRLRLKEPQLLALDIPVPPIDEQRHIVARIEALAARIAEARELRREAAEASQSLHRALLFGDESSLQPMRMGELVHLRAPDVEVRHDQTYHFAGVYSFGRGVFKGPTKAGSEFAYTRLTRLRAGDFVYPKLMAWEGALGIVPQECDALVVSPEFPVFSVDESWVLPEVLDVYFKMPAVWPLISGESTGTNIRRRRLQPADFLAFEIPLPPMPVQRRFRQMNDTLWEAERLQAESVAKLDALLPAVLDRAFRGEL